jgi:hypothetical protein
MVEGTLEVHWTNSGTPTATRRYRILFSAYGPAFQRGAQTYKEIVGEEFLSRYLFDLMVPTMSVERRTERVRQWLLEVGSAGHLSLDNMQLTDQQFAPFRRALALA